MYRYAYIYMCVCIYLKSSFLLPSSLENMTIDFIERGRGRERKKHLSERIVAKLSPIHVPAGDGPCNLVPGQEIKPAAFYLLFTILRSVCLFVYLFMVWDNTSTIRAIWLGPQIFFIYSLLTGTYIVAISWLCK